MPNETGETRPLVIVSKSEPEDATAKLGVFGINAVPGEVGSDYVWYPHGLKFAVERKTVTNLLQSLKDRQLVEQAQRGTKAFDKYFLLIEGEMRRAASGKLEFYGPHHPERNGAGWVTSGWAFDAVEGMLFELGLLGVQTVRCDSFDYARAVARMVINTSNETHKFLRERQRPDLPVTAKMGGDLYEDVVWSLCALPGVGPEVAMALLTEYGTLKRTIEALGTDPAIIQRIEPDPWNVKVNGKRLGEKRSARIREAVTKNWSQ